MAQLQGRPAAMLRCFLLFAVALLLAPVRAVSVNATILIIAADSPMAGILASGLRGYGIPYEIYYTSSGPLPTLNSSASTGKYGGFLTMNEILSSSQLATIYAYQSAFGVRMARLNAVPSADSG
jgi:hypothetical protein